MFNIGFLKLFAFVQSIKVLTVRKIQKEYEKLSEESPFTFS